MQSRQSRMDKYYDNNVVDKSIEATSSRTKKNQNLYKKVSSLELEDFDLNSNVSVISNNTDNINLDDIKDILDKKYHETPRKKSFGDTDELSLPEINLDETREYDINSILEKAKEKKEVNYEEDRLKKIRNTQYDILKSLDIMNNEEEIEEKEDIKPTDRKPPVKNEKSEKQLQDLINTITAKELINNEENLEVTGELDPLDILSDLRGDDDSTKVMGMLSEELDAANLENEQIIEDEDTLGIKVDDINKDEDSSIISQEEIKNSLDNYEEEKKDTKMKLDDSFIGQTTTFTQSDFDDFNDLKEDMNITKIIIKILIVLIILIFLAGLVLLANKYLGLGLF